MSGVFEPLADVLAADVIERMHRACHRYIHDPQVRNPRDSALTAGVRVLAEHRAEVAESEKVRRLEWNLAEARRKLTEHQHHAQQLNGYNVAVVNRVWRLLLEAAGRKAIATEDLRDALQPADEPVLPPLAVGELANFAAEEGHRCDPALCVCPVHGTPLYYARRVKVHACQDARCEADLDGGLTPPTIGG